MTRVLWIIALCGACASNPGSATPAECPTTQDGAFGDEILGAACDVPSDRTCFVENQFSPCMSAWYACVGHAFVYVRPLDATDGASCADSPIASCSFEGNPGCGTEPIARGCSCATDGTWQCACSCYDGTDCATCPASYTTGVMGTACGPVGNTCTYAAHTCSCVGNGGIYGTFECT